MAESVLDNPSKPTPARKSRPGTGPKPPTPSGYSSLLSSSAPSEWVDLLTRHYADIAGARIDIKLGRGIFKTYRMFPIHPAIDEDNDGALTVFFDGVSMPLEHAAGCLWECGQSFMMEENGKRHEADKAPLKQVHIKLYIHDSKRAELGSAGEKIKEDAEGDYLTEKDVETPEKLALATARDHVRENRFLRRDLADAQDRVRERDVLFTQMAEKFVMALGVQSEEKLGLVNQMATLGLGYESPEKIAVWSRLAGTAEIIAEGVADHGFGSFSSNKKKDDDDDDDDEKKEKKNKFKIVVDAITDEGWEVVMDHTSITEEEIAKAKETLIRIGRRNMPKPDDLIMAAGLAQILQENIEDLKEDLPKKDLKRFMRIGSLVKAKAKRMERKIRRAKEKEERAEAKEAAEESSAAE